jgi:FixJ family two-component response regulator
MTESTVYVVESDNSMRAGLARVVKSAGLHAETFPSAQDFLARLAVATGPACILADVCMPDVDGLGLQDLLNSVGSTYPVVFIIAGQVDVHTIVRVMKAGAVDVLEKPLQDDNLLHVLNSALGRAQQLFQARNSQNAVEKRHEALTPREREVFGLVTTGMLNKQVAWQLGIAEKTIKVHRGRVMQKMGANSLAELVRMADRLGISATAA